MTEMLASFLNMLMPISPMLTPVLLTGFVICAVLYFALANRYAPLTLDEAEILWKIHKQQAQCGARKWQMIRRGNMIVGFECKCGYRRLHKRPLV